MLSQLFTKLRAVLNLPTRVEARFDRLRQELDEQIRDIHGTLKSQDVRRSLEAHQARSDGMWEQQRSAREKLEADLAATHRELQERLQQHQLQLAHLRTLLENGSAARKDLEDPVPLSVTLPKEPPVPPAAIAWQWLDLDRCPGCATAERTVVCEWNKSILLEQNIFADSKPYNYALCHGCGMVYATHRPVGASYKLLMDDFPETIGRGSGANASNALLNPYPLSEKDRERYRALISGGVFVSDHEPREHLDSVYLDRIEHAGHVELLGSLLDLHGARVLEVRSRAGTILNGLRRQFDASVMAMPIFEGQQFILRELYGIDCSDLIDYDMFTISFEGRFDLIACNHMLTHIVRVDRFFEQIREHLKVGGHLYLYNELEENAFLANGKSVINTLNALHLQVSDRASLIRLLNANGFKVVFIKLRNSTQLCLAQYTDDRAWTPMPLEERDARVRAYALARAQAILRAPKALRGRFAAVWEEAVARGVEAGIVGFDDKGRPRLIKDT
jgi:SAM-dependent methyltransferase